MIRSRSAGLSPKKPSSENIRPSTATRPSMWRIIARGVLLSWPSWMAYFAIAFGGEADLFERAAGEKARAEIGRAAAEEVVEEIERRAAGDARLVSGRVGRHRIARQGADIGMSGKEPDRFFDRVREELFIGEAGADDRAGAAGERFAERIGGAAVGLGDELDPRIAEAAQDL